MVLLPLRGRGSPVAWKPGTLGDLLQPGTHVHELRDAWALKEADPILKAAGDLLGWDPQLRNAGFTVFDEAYENRYDCDLDDPEAAGFDELYFQEPEPEGGRTEPPRVGAYFSE
jgi:hypothetical protein